MGSSVTSTRAACGGQRGAKPYRVGSKSLRNMMMNRKVLWKRQQTPVQLSGLVLKKGTPDVLKGPVTDVSSMTSPVCLM